MAGEIRVGVRKIEGALEGIREALTEFGPYNGKFMSEAAMELDGFQADFMDGMCDLLENMADTKAPKLAERLEGFVQEIEAFKDSFQKADEDMAGKLEE